VNVGDVIRYKKIWIVGFGIVLEKGVWSANRDLKIMWADGEIIADKSTRFEVVSESG